MLDLARMKKFLLSSLTVFLLTSAGALAQSTAQTVEEKTGQAVAATESAAEKAAKHFHCTGAHQMGDKWMPCATHAELEPPPAAQSQRP